MNREEYLKKVTVGGPSLLNSQIELSEYDPAWPEIFKAEKEKISAALGDRAKRIEHVGSTSVPGLCAKPIIDILLLVEDSNDECYKAPLEAAGYIFRIREPDWYAHRMFKGNNPAVNLHVFSEGCEEAGRMLLFRDWLRKNGTDSELYAAAKKELSQKVWKYVQNYADAKTAVVREIMAHAEAEQRKSQAAKAAENTEEAF